MIFKTNSNIDAIIVGLGNPGGKYDGTRHNTGFCAIDYCAKEWNIKITKAKFDALYGVGTVEGKKLLLLKPQTFMNLSGEAVHKASEFYKISPDKIIVMFDDISLDCGRIRLRRKGCAGGHNGIKSIIAHIGEDFPRIKIGVGEKPCAEYDLAAWVLSRFTDKEAKAIAERYDDIAKAALLIACQDMDKAMNKYSS
ncbi:MAG: aminoacyl-tRNA hydrolase [Oscillospiraceae bacterium]